MKKHHLFLFVLLLAITILTASCGKDDKSAPPSDCIDEKIEAFQLELGSQAIYKIDAPSGTLYLFEHSCVDCGDYVYNANCEEVCVTNLEGYDPGVVPCDQSFYNSPRTKIWEN